MYTFNKYSIFDIELTPFFRDMVSNEKSKKKFYKLYVPQV